jgi:hypothetical protein
MSKLLMALLKQLSLRKDAITDDVLEMLELQKSGDPPSLMKVEAALLATFPYFSEAFIILDGLDECDETNRQDLSHVIRTLRSSQCKLLAVSRDRKDIRDLFDDCPHFEISARNEDIDRFVRSRLLEHPHVRGMMDSFLLNLISDKIQKAANETYA